MNNPRFTVIVPTYNAAPTLQACLNSITDQDYQDIEIVIVDGGSTDSTVKIIENFAGRFPLVKWRSAPDDGIYDAMNKGVKMATGDYLYFLGSDDTLYENTVFSKIAHYAIETNAQVIYGNVLMHGSNQFVAESHVHAGKFELKRLLSHNICHQSIFYRSNIFDEIGLYNIKYPVFADHDFNLRCFARYPFAYIDCIIANFHVGGASSRLTDPAFEHDKPANIITYFFNKLHTRSFIELRLYVQQGAFSKTVSIGLAARLYCLLVYAKLKTQSLFN